MHSAVFVHVPKSGGTSASSFFKSCLGEANVCETMDGSGIAQSSHAKLFTGHFKLRDLAPDTLDYFKLFSFIRSPLDTSLSNYYFKRSSSTINPLLPDSSIKLCRQKELHEVLLEHEHLELSQFGNPVTAQLSRLAPTASLSEHLRNALEGLASLDAVGLFERFQESLYHVCAVMAWPRAAKVKHLNKTPERKAIDQLPNETVALLKKINQADLELYAIAAERFRKDLKNPKTISPGAKRIAKPLACSHERSEMGSKDFTVKEISFGGVDTTYYPYVVVPEGTRLIVRYLINVSKPQPDLTIGIGISDEQGVSVFGTSSRLLKVPVPTASAGQEFSAFFAFDQQFLPGDYYVSATLHKGLAHTEGCYHWIENAAKFKVVPNQIRPVLSHRAAGVDFGVCPQLRMDKLPSSAVESVYLRVAAGPILALSSHLWVLLENYSPYWLHSSGPHPVHISYKPFSHDGVELIAEGLRTRIDPPLEPNGRRVYPILVDPDLSAGCLLKVSLVQEKNFWFYEIDSSHASTIRIPSSSG
jgi:hypothetical protein